MKKFFLSLLVVAGIGGVSFGQAFQKTLSQSGIDFNHYSIEQTKYGGIICAGTIFDNSTGYTDMHVLHLDAMGNIMWQKTIDITNYDRLLDVEVGPGYEIAITGYVTPTLIDEHKLYIARLDDMGNMINDKRVDINSASAGTNIIYSQLTSHYIVGGFHSDPVTYPLIDNKAFLIEFDMSLNIAHAMSYSTGANENSCINDIIEVPGGYFITGSVGSATPGQEQGVLALFIDDTFNVTADVSFESTNAFHTGVSAIYDAASDEVFLMSNNSVTHNPEIARIVDIASGSPYIMTYYTLMLDPTLGAAEASGYQLMVCPWNSNHLVAAGYFKHVTIGATPNNALPWLIEFDPATGTQVGGLLWQTLSPNYASHGGAIFSNFNGAFPHGYIYNQEILMERADSYGLVFVGPRRVGSNFGVDIATTTAMNLGTCLSTKLYTPTPKTFTDISVSQTSEFPTALSISAMVNPWVTNVHVYCAPEEYEEGAELPLSITEMSADLEDLNFVISPNPFNDNFQIRLEGSELSGRLIVRNALGQIVYQSEQISGDNFITEVNAEQFSKGIYTVSYSDANGNVRTEKVVKL